VSAQQLIAAAWPNGIRRATVLATRISALRSRVTPLGLEIRESSSRGYVMVATPTAVTLGDAGGFEDELEAARLLDTDRPARSAAADPGAVAKRGRSS
jgi:DNA-binding winged helix-turn-helix (wHTH) protein